MDFHPVHAYTEGLYNEMSVLFDDMAERTIILGDKPYLTIEELRWPTTSSTWDPKAEKAVENF